MAKVVVGIGEDALRGSGWDEAYKEAIDEIRPKFHQCSRCGKWVCPEVCWNAAAGQCEECAPDYQEELASAHAQAKADATREQLHEKARATDYVSQVDMRAGATFSAGAAGGVKGAKAASRKCVACEAEVGQAKFCPECGTPTAPARPTCTGCGHQPDGSPKFCPECGAKMSAGG